MNVTLVPRPSQHMVLIQQQQRTRNSSAIFVGQSSEGEIPIEADAVATTSDTSESSSVAGICETSGTSKLAVSQGVRRAGGHEIVTK